MLNRSLLLSLALVSSTAQADPRSEHLHQAVRSWPDVNPGLVDPAVDAALAEETPEVPAELLLSLMWHETRLDPSVRTGAACGVLQVVPRDVGGTSRSCLGWSKDLRSGVAAGVLEMQMMLWDRRVRGSLRRALAYRSCGNAAFRGGCGKQRWVESVLTVARSLEQKPRPKAQSF